MLWQVTSGSYYNAINEGIPYEHYLKKARACMKLEKTKDKYIQEHIGYFKEIERVCTNIQNYKSLLIKNRIFIEVFLNIHFIQQMDKDWNLFIMFL